MNGFADRKCQPKVKKKDGKEEVRVNVRRADTAGRIERKNSGTHQSVQGY